MRPAIPLLAFSFFALPALAQTPSATPAPAAPAPAGTATPVPAAPAHSRMTMKERFDQANTTHDGHLTLDQAKAGMPALAKHFGAVDKDKKGYVTLEDIHAYNVERRAAHHAAARHPASPS